MLYPLIAIAIARDLLVGNGVRFVAGAAATASNLGMSAMLIGLTIVSFGTSAPEIVVSLMAVLDEAGSLAVGNALGSNIANIGLVLGITALVAPLPVKSNVLKKEIPLLLGVTLLAGATLYDGELSLTDGALLLISLFICLGLFAKFSQQAHSDTLLEEEQEDIPDLPTSQAVFWLVSGLVVLIGSSKALVWGATSIATAMGVSELVIGLTIVAIGTSLPELAASVASALKGHHDIALGNVVGSNIFNLGAVMAIPGFAGLTGLGEEVFNRDYLLMLGLTLSLVVFALVKKPSRIGRFAGVLLTCVYTGYLVILYNASV